jgi:microcystin-dependent protein
MATTTTYGLNKPTVGGDENTWGGLTNDNWDDVDDLLDGTTPITPNLGAGWEVGGVAVTASAAELNLLDGKTAEDFFPSGGIIMWSGAIANIPSGWFICDGTNGTPDLTGRFVVHADADSGGTYDVGDTGGVDSVTLSEAQLPPHTHTGSTSSAGSHSHFVARNTAVGADYTPNLTGSGAVSWGNNTTGIFEGYNLRNTDAGPANVGPTNTDGEHTHTFTTAATGDGTAHENRPPYYALAYIMKA